MGVVRVWSINWAWHVGVVIMVPETISKKLRPMQRAAETEGAAVVAD